MRLRKRLSPSEENNIGNKNRAFFSPGHAIQAKLKVNEPGDTYEREADAMAEHVMRTGSKSTRDSSFFKPAESGIQRKCQQCEEEDKFVHRKEGPDAVTENTNHLDNYVSSLNSSGQPLSESSRQFFEPRFGQDFSDVRIHMDTEATKSAQSINALAYTTGNNIVFNSGQYSPDSDNGKKLMAHELTHVVQQKNSLQPKAIQRLPSDLSGYPAADTGKIQIRTVVVEQSSLPDLKTIFATNAAAAGGLATVSTNANGTVIFNSNVPKTPSSKDFDVRRGLQSIAGELQSHAKDFPVNTTVTIELDLTPFGGAKGNYRFTYFEHGTGKLVSEVMLIEQLNKVTKIATATDPDSLASAGPFKVGKQDFILGSGWTKQRQALLLQALNMLSAAELSQIAGLTFEIGADVPGEGGSYEYSTNTITMRDKAFSENLNRHADGNEAIRMILHEIGHALDMAPLRKALENSKKKGADPLTKAVSPSGSKFKLNDSELYVPTEDPGSTAFRSAVISDRTLKGVALPDSITAAGAENWEQNFAESFAMYMADRALFKTLRPNTYAYFHRVYP